MGEAIRELLRGHRPLPNFLSALLFWRRSEVVDHARPDEDHYVGDFRVDYSDIPDEEWRASDPACEQLLGRSKVVWTDREV